MREGWIEEGVLAIAELDAGVGRPAGCGVGVVLTQDMAGAVELNRNVDLHLARDHQG